ncbi:hypothetical protein FIV41_13465 [Pseudomonas marginalis]|uniref:Flagellar assembly protein H n=1 Tax=Pseudomonas marginalis TaxID=298 RepID=A0A9X9FXX4_PSEMA|nr:hypothetical protein [Pseudomonas marginalis]TWR59758.1 hypothetical protein FIV41_13465 [Pseudomonas marginalis]SED27328.1 hypothetical protein SAMN04490193_5141 [Pseudomonas marginalis]
MTAFEVLALISFVIALAILYWVGYRGGLKDGWSEGYDDGHGRGYIEGIEEGESSSATALEKATRRCERLELILIREPQDRQILLAIAGKLKLAADFFHAIKSEGHATQALVLRDHALSMAEELGSFHQEDPA